MTDADRREFAEGMAVLLAVFPRQPSDLLLEAYLRAQRQYSISEVLRAIDDAVKRCTFFPAPSELIGIVQEHRRALRDEQQARRSLKPGPESEAERAAAAAAMAQFRELLNGLEGRMNLSRATAAPKPEAPLAASPETTNGRDDKAAYAERKRRELARFSAHLPNGDGRYGAPSA